MIQNNKWFNSKTSTYFISDLVGISFSAYFALIARFGAEETLPTINVYILQFDYLGLLVVLALGWVLSLIMTGAYDSNSSLNLLNDLQILTKCSVIYFFALGFTSFVFRASFSRMIFVLFLIAGLFSIFTCRFIVHLLIIRPKMKKREFAKEMLLVGRDSQEIKQYSEWISDNPSLG